MHIKAIVIAAILSGAGLTAGCATTPDPAVICTAEWIKPRTARAVKELRRDTGRTIKSLKKNAAKLEKGGKLAPFRAASMINSVQKLATKIERGRGVRDLKTLAATCNDPSIVRDGVVGYMQDVEAPKVLLDMIRAIDFEKMTRETAPLDIAPAG